MRPISGGATPNWNLNRTGPGYSGQVNDSPRRPPGRPRDLDAEERLLVSVLLVYGERGWHGLTMQAVARHAKVSKGLLYSRWSNVTDLLVAAFRKHIKTALGEYDNIRDTLRAEGRRAADLYLGPYRLAFRRLWVEGLIGPPEVVALHEEINDAGVGEVRRRVRAARDRGELPANVSTVRLLDTIEGAIWAHIAATSEANLPKLVAGMDSYIDGLVDGQLRLARLDASAEAAETRD